MGKVLFDFISILTLALILTSSVSAEPLPKIPRTIPPKGIQLKSSDRDKLESLLNRFEMKLDEARKSDVKIELSNHLPDIEIYHKAIRFALENNEFFKENEVKTAYEVLATGEKRLDSYLNQKTPWTTQAGLVVRGYQSKLDKSVQPYGLVIPEKLDLSQKVPLIVWLHGRGNTLSEINFIKQRETKKGIVTPSNAIVLHPYGRYCNAFKFAGEVDVFESIDSVKKNYNIDEDRVVLWGFSMGGAGCWHLGAHHPDQWVAMSPGAGFAETALYQRLKPDQYPGKIEQTLWKMFDVPNYARNLLNLPVIAYSGEVDKQKQAADVMEAALAKEDMKLKHLIGPKMGHKYHPDTLKEITALIQTEIQKGRNNFPKEIHLQTQTLRYNKCFWIEVVGLEKHWQDSRVDAKLNDDHSVTITTKNIFGFTLIWPEKTSQEVGHLNIDGQKLRVAAPDQKSKIYVGKVGNEWQVNARHGKVGPRKSHGAQGPIDDFMLDSFIVVTPSGKCKHPKVEKWVQAELAHFQDRWKRLFRGELVIKKDTEITLDDINNHHLILWGDVQSNKMIQQAVSNLPIDISGDSIKVQEKEYDASNHIASFICPNRLGNQGPLKYIVINSGMTFREGHDGTNSLQNPKLGDWAVINIDTPPDQFAPGKIEASGFFNEHWYLD